MDKIKRKSRRATLSIDATEQGRRSKAGEERRRWRASRKGDDPPRGGVG